MSQFRPLRAVNNHPSGDHRASTTSVISATDTNVTHTVQEEPQTTPLPVASRITLGIPKKKSGNALQASNSLHASFGATPWPSTVSQPGMMPTEQRYLPAPVSRAGTQTWISNPNPRSLSISLPLQHHSRTAVPGRALVVRSGRAPLVIAGSRRHVRDTDALVFKEKHLHAHVRHGLVILATLGVFLLMMLSLTPIEQGNGSVLAGLFQTQKVPANALTVSPQDAGTNSGIPGINDPSAGTRDYYVGLARADALKYGISPDLYVRQIQQESHFDPNAVSGVGAIGIAQFMPATAADMHFDPTNPVAALDGGARFMSDLNNEFYGDYAKALAGYNAGPGAVQNAVASCGTAWLSCVDPQAQAYVYIIEGW